MSHTALFTIASGLSGMRVSEPARIPQIPTPSPEDASAGAIDSDDEVGKARLPTIQRNLPPKKKNTIS